MKKIIISLVLIVLLVALVLSIKSLYETKQINYQNDKVQRFFVIPNNVYIQAFTQVHGNRDKNYNNGTMIYDDNPFNQFSVKVYFDPNGQIKAIENVNQVSLSY
ncbi:hypothetical protein K2V52_04260 [Staphylococcus nepalensis]|uniref:hypothetical protein n=1 Tax=Staphylococcus nepalensis TaxID=214473 RepID=UPI001E499071|nr:hypothetical protein [Staphylococcus nepalensis]MCD8891178.1 hypothetical protein [Staphylococcus nepalensis]